MAATREVPLVRAAQLLGLSWGQVLRLVLRGELVGRQGDTGRWYVQESSVERVRREQAEKAAAR